MSGYGEAGTGAGRPTMGERIKEAIPGTEEYRATHGVTGAHANAQNAKVHIPGTEEHRLRDAGVVGGGTGMAGHGTHGVGQPTMTERVKESIPGTREYEATHGMTGAHSSAQQAKAHIPGTDEHRVATSMEPGYGTGAGGLTGAGAGGLTGAGAGAHHPHTAGTHAGGQELGSGPLGMGTAGIGSGQERMGAAATGEQREGLGHKVMKHIPGTREHEEKKLAEGRI